MNKDIIGIKLSDGSFYPVLTNGIPAEKQLKLTTARDGQTSIRLHLYRSASGAMEDAEYIDSLRIDGLASREMNGPTVSLSVSLDADGTIAARLTDSETGISASKTVPMALPASALSAEESLPEIDDMPDIPDFNLGSETDTDSFNFDLDIPEPMDSSEFDVPPLTEEDLDFDTPADSFANDDIKISKTASILSDINPSASSDTKSSNDFSMNNSPFTDSSLYDGLTQENDQKKSGVSVPLAICIVCAVICLCVLGIMLFISPPKWFTGKQEEVPGYTYDGPLIPDTELGEIPSPYENIITVADEPIIPEQPVIIEPDAEESTRQIRHLVKWGDTLWDIAGTYYKNPWAYPRIARENNIQNPDFIVSGTILIIPR